ncbi:MAG: type II secretion system F family protein [Roseburia sp.]|nr:type II secretion system F family protein [Roseburia sp.]MCM1098927.1 type II secretion system F family protein [Ruminococcus flavefaciens]
MKEIRFVTGGISLATGILVFLAFWFIRTGWHPEKKLLKAYRELSGLIRETGGSGGFYQKSKRRLEKTGAAFHYGKWVEPLRFLALRLVLGMAGSFAGAALHPVWGIAAFLFLFFLPSWLLSYLNKRDNERLLPELKLVYHSLEIQIKAGVYVTDALAECYGSVQEKRLRQALLELAGDIVMKADIYDSLERFQGKFDNRYVDSLCITLLQALESGQAVELLRDIGEQIKDMEETVLERKKAALDRRITFCQLGVLTVVLGLALYACVSYMFGAASIF